MAGGSPVSIRPKVVCQVSLSWQELYIYRAQVGQSLTLPSQDYTTSVKCLCPMRQLPIAICDWRVTTLRHPLHNA